MQLWIQVIVSCLIVAGVLWFMWRLPLGGEALFGVAPIMALGSIWAGLGAAVISAVLWWVAIPDSWLVAVLLLLDPGAIAGGVLVLWIYRGPSQLEEGSGESAVIRQAWMGISLGLVAVVLGYVFVMTHKQPFTPVGM